MIVAIEEANSNQNIRVIIICGSGERAFTSGADIKEIKNYSGTEMEPYNRRWIKLFSIIEKSPKPVIAAVNGFATGGGQRCHLHVILASLVIPQNLVLPRLIWCNTRRRCGGPINEVGWAA